MNAKEIKILTEIKADLKKSLDTWEGFLNIVEPGLVGHDWVIAENVSGPVARSVKKIDQALQDNDTVKKLVSPGDPSAILEVCSVCRLLLNSKDVDWEFMKETNTWQVVCKDCAKIFDNYKGDK